MSHSVLLVYADASVQPDATGLGVAIKDEQGKLITWRNKAAKAMTCNEAEYAALIFALEQALAFNPAPREVRVFSDSRLIIEQMLGWIQVRNGRLQALHRQARQLAGRFKQIGFTHIPRERNRLADAIASEAIATAVVERDG